jgi:hypothetical protein
LWSPQRAGTRPLPYIYHNPRIPREPNELHWTLDVAFQEDKHQLAGNGAANFAVLRHIATSLLKQEKSARRGIANKRLKAVWADAYLLKLLQPG